MHGEVIGVVGMAILVYSGRCIQEGDPWVYVIPSMPGTVGHLHQHSLVMI